MAVAAVWYHRLTLDRLKPRTIEQSHTPLPSRSASNAMPMPMSPFSALHNFRKQKNDEKPFHTHTHTHRRSLYTIAFTFATSKSPIYPHMSCTIPKPWLIINRGFCFVSFCFLFFFFSGGGNLFSWSETVCTSDSHLGRPQKRLHIVIAYSDVCICMITVESCHFRGMQSSLALTARRLYKSTILISYC